MDASVPPWFQLPDAPNLIKSNMGSESEPFVIVGAGLAGCNLAFELAQRHQHVLLIDKGADIAAGASGHSAGIVKPFVTREPSAAATFYTAAFEYFLQRMQGHDFAHDTHFTQCGVLQLVQKPYPANSVYRRTTPAENSVLAGVPVDSHGIFFERAGWVNPAAFCSALLASEKIKTRLNCSVNELIQTNDGWRIECTQLMENKGIERKQTLNIETGQLIVCNGAALHAFKQTNAIPIVAARGQISVFKPVKPPTLKTVISAKQYLIPTSTELHVGASFKRNNVQEGVNATEHQQNLNGLKALNADIRVNPNPSSGFAGIRATTPDRLPVVGPVPDVAAYEHKFALLKNGLPENRFDSASYQHGLHVLGGLGSRGIVSAPYCARLLSDWLCSSLPPHRSNNETLDSIDTQSMLQSNSDLLHPARFIIRQLRRAR